MEPLTIRATSPSSGRANESDGPDEISWVGEPTDSNQPEKSNESEPRCNNTDVKEPEPEEEKHKGVEERRRPDPDLESSTKTVKNKSRIRRKYSASPSQGVFVYPDTANSNGTRHGSVEGLSLGDGGVGPSYDSGPEALREFQANLLHQEMRNKRKIIEGTA
ncbi:hypothetical protein O1611_g5446 [Lasiodiplodia mahajangana]|uniref:Uncharacterized protein n=1 Tax=Lasiodiplodia mahajangana TaxID=1108764 RepID=A0ACC2JL53_9PEZI|nr:hypothetical protein O1611_g5446 [Lasiodiplodia mahajangana]